MIYEPRRPPRHETLRVRGLEHRLTWWGEPTGSPIVLLHGFMDAGDTWQFLVDCLPDSWSCVAPDWRGFGGSGWAPGGYWFPDYLADLDAMLDALVPNGRARVVGHSMGGNVAAIYAGARPQRLAWLANLEGLGLPRQPPSLAPSRYEQWLDQLDEPPRESRYESLAQLTRIIQMRNPRLPPDKAAFVARAWSRPDGDGVRLAADPRHRLVNPVLYRREEAEACWRRMEIPMLLVIGERSEVYARQGRDATDEVFRAVFPDVRIVRIPGAGHMLHYEEPEAVARHLVEFAERHAARL